MEVAFRTQSAQKEAKDSRFEEWMLWCPAESISDEGRIEYFVSRALETRRAFVYSRDYKTGQLFLESSITWLYPISVGSDKYDFE
jgi:hypothetical protein